MSKHVLLIDDDPIFHIIFTRMIQKINPQLMVTSYLNGKLALDFLSKDYSINNEYIILLDINMPEINGWQFLLEIKQREGIKTDNITLFVVTSSTDIDDINKAQSYDFVEGILSKPLSVDSIKHIIQPKPE